MAPAAPKMCLNRYSEINQSINIQWQPQKTIHCIQHHVMYTSPFMGNEFAASIYQRKHHQHNLIPLSYSEKIRNMDSVTLSILETKLQYLVLITLMMF